MKPPFFGTKVLDNVGFHKIAKFIDQDALFASRWQFKKGQSQNEWRQFIKTSVLPLFERLITRCDANDIIAPKAVYGYFECRKQENALLVTSAGKGDKIYRFEFPRQRQSPNLCVSDLFPDGFITMQLVTVGQNVIEEGARLFQDKKYAEVFYLKGLAAECAEATAGYCHELIRKELNADQGRGCRFSFGYPSAPNLMEQEKLYALLEGGRIGVGLTETFQLVPEYSTSAIISFSPEAKHFRP